MRLDIFHIIILGALKRLSDGWKSLQTGRNHLEHSPNPRSLWDKETVPSTGLFKKWRERKAFSAQIGEFPQLGHRMKENDKGGGWGRSFSVCLHQASFGHTCWVHNHVKHAVEI